MQRAEASNRLGVPRASEASALRVIAFAANRTWVCAFFMSALMKPLFGHSESVMFSDSFYLVSATVLAVGLAACGVAHRFVDALLDTRMGCVLGPVICLASVAALAIPLCVGQAVNAPEMVVASIGTGVGSSLVLLDVGRCYRGSSTKVYAYETVVATVAAAFAIVVLSVAPWLLSLAIVNALPFLASLAARFARRAANEQPARSTRAFGEVISKQLVVKFIAAASVLGLLTSFMRYAYATEDALLFGSDYDLKFAVGSVVAALVVLVAVVAARRFTVGSLYRPTLFLFTVAFSFFPLLGVGSSAPGLLLNIGYTLFEILLWVMLCDTANRFQFTYVQVFGLGRAMSLALLTLGTFAFVGLGTSLEGVQKYAAVVSAVAVCLVATLHLYVLTSSDLQRYSSVLTEDGQSLAGNEESSGNDPDESSAKPAEHCRLPLAERCRIVGAYYGLSPRELDVFRLLAIGRNAARIKEELYISTGTVNTHAYHIYQKLGVHSQQELIDLMLTSDFSALAQEVLEREQSSGR